jgi:hypothetical protein
LIKAAAHAIGLTALRRTHPATLMRIDMGAQEQQLHVSDPRAIRRTGLVALLLLAGLATTWPHILAAQSPAPTDDAVRVGDRWTFDTKDEITGFPTDTITQVVTELSPNEIVVRTTTRGKNGSGLVVFDHDWNRLENSTVKFKPNDGQGIRPPLAVGKEWKSEYEARNTQTGSASKTSFAVKIVAQEMVTTAAGTFDTFKFQSHRHEISSADPSKSWDSETVGWYAPAVNHWVRRAFLTKVQKRTTANTSEELVDFSRKP